MYGRALARVHKQKATEQAEIWFQIMHIFTFIPLISKWFSTEGEK